MKGQGEDAGCNAFVMLLRVLLGVPGRCAQSRSLLSGIGCFWQGSPKTADWFSWPDGDTSLEVCLAAQVAPTACMGLGWREQHGERLGVDWRGCSLTVPP